MRRKFDKNLIQITVCAITVLLCVLISLVTSSANGAEYKTVPENTYDFYAASRSKKIIEENTKAYVIYINDNPVCFDYSYDGAVSLLNNAVEKYAEETYGEFTTLTLLDSATVGETTETQALELCPYGDMGNIAFSVKIIKTFKRTEDIAFDTVTIEDSDLKSGKNVTVTEGRNGVVEQTVEDVIIDGVLQSETVVEETVITEKVDAVLRVGVMSASDTSSVMPIFIMPYDGGITSEYGERYLLGGTFHGGVDIAAKVAGDSVKGEEFAAAGDGVVVFAGSRGDFGNLTIIEHRGGIQTWYAHQYKILVKVGDEVKQGDIIGRIGDTGLVTGPHLHFEVRVLNSSGEYERVDPRYYIKNYDSYYR